MPDNIAARRLHIHSAGGVFATVLAAHLVILLAVGLESWDDGYITLALARTFAETGHIGLTPVSEHVEGATSPLWFLLMAGIYKIGITSFAGFHIASQVVAALCSAAAAVLFYRLIQPAAPTAAWWITVLVFLLGPIRAETGNGMEMSLLCLVVLGILLLLRDDGSRWPGVAALAALVPWIRLEATGYVIAGALAVWLFSSPRNRRSLVAIVLASFGSVAVLVLVRYLVFGTVLFTNTMIAKQMPPYSPPYPSAAWWGQQVDGLIFEPVVTALPAVVVFMILLRMSGQRLGEKFAALKSRAMARTVPLPVSFGLAYAVGFFGFTAVFGANVFTLPGRMGMSVTLLLVVAAMSSVSLPESAGRREVPRGAKLAVVGLFLVPCAGLIAYDTIGMTMRVAQLVTDDERAKVYSFSAFRANGEAMERVRRLLDQPQISVLLTDVGQPGLCCKNVEILDFGLLANSELTRTGWAGFPEYLREQSPDLIQLHSSFTQESGITRDEYFTKSYVPVFVDLSLFYMRKDHYAQLENSCVFGPAPKYYFFTGGEPLSSQKGAPADSALHIDKDYLKSLGLTEYCRLP
ncbi:MAG: hypothetical protein E6Q56_01840 [Mycobacterium sp.]|nr:MAG: hypothetical protein E6Q56_01840 [Mycobacterium sp.]